MSMIKEELLIPSLSIRTYVKDKVKHQLSPADEVTLLIKNPLLFLKDKAKVLEEVANRYGIQLAKDYLSYLNKVYAEYVSYKGTTYEFESTPKEGSSNSGYKFENLEDALAYTKKLYPKKFGMLEVHRHGVQYNPVEETHVSSRSTMPHYAVSEEQLDEKIGIIHVFDGHVISMMSFKVDPIKLPNVYLPFPYRMRDFDETENAICYRTLDATRPRKFELGISNKDLQGMSDIYSYLFKETLSNRKGEEIPVVVIGRYLDLYDLKTKKWR